MATATKTRKTNKTNKTAKVEAPKDDLESQVDDLFGGEEKAEGEDLVDPSSAVDPETSGDLVVVPGTSLDLWKDTAAVFCPLLKKDMTPEERQNAVRNINRQALKAQGQLSLMSGELLHEVRSNSYWKVWTFIDETGDERPYKTFEEYAAEELSLGARKANYLTSIYEKFVIELQLSAEELRDIEWSKAAAVIGVINEENKKEMLEAVKTKTLRQLSDIVQAMKSKNGSEPKSRTPSDIVKKTFLLTPDQASQVETALDLAASITESDSDAFNLHAICSEFVATSVGGGAEGGLQKLDAIIAHLEQAFACELEVKHLDESRYGEQAGGESEEEDDELIAPAKA